MVKKEKVMKYIIGIDAGTSNVKAVLFDTAGQEIFMESMDNEPVYIGDTEVEQNMDILWEKVLHCLISLLQHGPAKKEEILGIGVTGQGEGIWLVDEQGKPVQDAILWCDGRAVDEVDEMTKIHPELGELIFKTTGTPPLTGTQLMLLKWMKNHRKEVLDRASTMFFCKDWTRYKLTGDIHGDLSDTGTSLMDASAGKVAVEMLNQLDLGEYADLIAPPVDSATIVGFVSDDLAEKIGLNKGTPVIAGAIDVVASAVGIGAVSDKDICVILGTTCANEIFKKKEDCVFGEEGTRYEKHAVGDLFVNLMPTMNGTPNIDWVLKEIAKTTDFKEVDEMIKDIPAGSHGVIYHPYVSAAGERAPFYHPYAKANFFGIAANTSCADLVHAVYEGISISIKDCLQRADKDSKVYLAGGGAKSGVWAQMIADVLGMEVVVSSGNEFGAKGAALMLGVAVGEYDDYEDAVRKACRAKCIYYPRKDQSEAYENIYKLYKDFRIVVSDLWTERAKLMKKLNAKKA